MKYYAQIHLSLWVDDDFRTLTPGAQHLYMALLCHPTLTQCGVLDWRPKRIAKFAAGWTPTQVETAAAELEQHTYLIVDDDTEEAFIRSYARNNNILKQPNIAIAMAKAYREVASPHLRASITQELARLHDEHPDLSGWTPATLELIAETPDNEASNPSPDPSGNPQTNPSHRGSERGYPIIGKKYQVTDNQKEEHAHPPVSERPEDRFDEFWSLVPRKVGKDKARAKFAAAVRRTGDAQVVIDGMRRFANDPNLPAEKQYIPHPATWLEGGRWGDEPLPARNGPDSAGKSARGASGGRTAAPGDYLSILRGEDTGPAPAQGAVQAVAEIVSLDRREIS
ncbi:hypothetical protein [Corynebacterium kalidii]